jgi:hypothetical protein
VKKNKIINKASFQLTRTFGHRIKEFYHTFVGKVNERIDKIIRDITDLRSYDFLLDQWHNWLIILTDYILIFNINYKTDCKAFLIVYLILRMEICKNLINKHLKDFNKQTNKIEEDCWYINLIHLQRLRKSYEYLDW